MELSYGLLYLYELFLYLGICLIAWLLGRFSRKLDATPQREWNEIDWIHRLARLGLIAAFLCVLIAPVWWLALR